MTSEQARMYFKEKGLTYDCLNKFSVDLLVSLIQVEVMRERKIDKDCILVRINRPAIKKLQSIICAFLTVKGTYFDDREAISFNPDGFIGFCGWASSKNSRPFIDGFIKWCDEISEAEEVQAK